MTRSSTSREVKIVLVTVFLVEMGLALVIHLSQMQGVPGYEAVVRTGVGADLLAGESRGRQGFIGSLDWTPLPTLLMLPFLAWPKLAETGLAASIIAAGSLAGACAFLTAWWAGCRIPLPARIVAIFVLCLCPWTVMSVARGDGSLLFALLTLASVALTIRWLEQTRLSFAMTTLI